MKILILGIFVISLFSCSNKEGRKAADYGVDFSLSVKDTLIINPGEEILYLNQGLRLSEVDKNSRFLYNFNEPDNAIEIIDLNQLKFQKKVRFEKEGPNGTGGYIQSMNYKGGDNILLTENHQISLFNPEAKKIATYKILDQDYIGDTLNDEESLSTGGLLAGKGKHFITTYSQGFGEPLGIAKIRLQDLMLQKIPVPGLQDLAKFRVSFSDGRGKSASYPGIYLQSYDDKILISNNAVNELFIFDLNNDSLNHYSFNSRIIPNSQKENLRIEVNSQEEFQKITTERRKEVSFGRFTYDIQNNRYYRLSQKFIKETPEGNIFKPVLTIFDGDFNQIFETEDLPIDKMFWKYFVKDGNLYLYENVMDEMGFIVMEIEAL